jgi:pimeloyl-ACP methyl ester carboxylesterase
VTGTAGDFAGLVDIGGRSLYLECHGTGSPTVILEAGGGNNGSIWSVLPAGISAPAVFPGVAGFTRVCVYDRPGTVAEDVDGSLLFSRSDPVPQPTTPAGDVAALHALLHAAGVPGPYVLAGHSFGGLLARFYAATYPEEVVGLVLIDAYSEAALAALSPAFQSVWLATNFVPPPDLLAAYPTYERIDLVAATSAMTQAAAVQPLRPMPLAALSAGVIGEPGAEQTDIPAGYSEALVAANRASQAFNASLVPNAREFFASTSGHYIQGEQPALVIEAIRQVVTGVRDPDTWYDLRDCCAH